MKNTLEHRRWPQRVRIGALSKLFLNYYPNAAAAFSVRKLSSTFNGYCVKVRRSSDNQLLDIGFVNNLIDTDTLLSFCNGSSAYVHTWYDQSGNNNDIVLPVNSTQPQIVDSGVLKVHYNGMPSIQTDGVGSFMMTSISHIVDAPSLSVLTAYSSIASAAPDTLSVNLWSIGDLLAQPNAIMRVSTTASLAGEYLAYLVDRTVGDGKRLGSSTYRRDLNDLYVECDLIKTTGIENYQNGEQQTIDLGNTVNGDFTPATANVLPEVYFGCIRQNGSPFAFTKTKYSEIIIYPYDITNKLESIEQNRINNLNAEIIKLDELGVEETQPPQGFDVWGDYGFQLYNAGTMAVFNVKTKTLIDEIQLTDVIAAATNLHNNNACWGNEYVTGNSNFPILYISEGYGTHKCFAVNINVIDGIVSETLIQTISFNGTGYETSNSYDWVTDRTTNFIYSIGNTIAFGEVGNTIRVKKFIRPSINSGDVVFDNSDVIETFELNEIGAYQGTMIRNGYLYVLEGISFGTYYLRIYNLTSNNLVKTIDLNTLAREPEGIAYSGKKMYISYLANKGLIYKSDWLIG